MIVTQIINNLAKFIQNQSIEPVTAPEFWDWHNQDKWGGNCNSIVMQSPINLNYTPTLTGPEQAANKDPAPIDLSMKNLKFQYNFKPKVDFTIVKSGSEMIVKFNKLAGAFKFDNGSTTQYLTFTPTHMSFRFPAEFTVNNFRPDGEIVINMEQVTPNHALVINLL